MGRSEHLAKRNRLLRAGGVELKNAMVGRVKPRARKSYALWRSGAAVRSYLRVDTAQLDGVSYARNSQHICGDAVVDAVRVREMDDVFKGLAQDELKLLIHGGLFPEIALAVLHPLKIRRGDAAGVGKNVWNDE